MGYLEAAQEQKKLFSQKAIAIATFFGGPLAAGILVRRNFINLGNEKYGINALIIGITSTLLLFAGIFAIPDAIIEKVPSALIPAVYTAIIYWIVQNLQGEALKQHKENEGAFYSGWKAAGIGAVAMLVIAAGLFAFVMQSESNFDAGAYDAEITLFIENEQNSIRVFQLIETETPNVLYNEFNKSLELWRQNKKIVEKINAIENLTDELVVQNEKLMRYCDLRIAHFEVILAALKDGTDRYTSRIESVGMEIEKVLKELE